MPPKKKKDDSKKKEKKVSKKFTSGPQTLEQLSEQSRDYYLTQIRDLESRINRYQKKCDELEVRNSEFREQFEQLEDNKKDIVAFIKKKLDEKVDEISDLNDRLVGLQQSKDQDRDAFEQQLQQLRNEYRETKDQLTSENMMLSGKLASLEEFRVQREEIMRQTAELEATLQEQERIHQEHVYDIEKKQVIDKDRLKKEMVSRVNQVAAEFRKASNRQMAETTKRTIRENVAISTQLSKMSDKTVELLSTNDSLRERERRQRQEIELFQASETILAKKNIANQKMIQMLMEKCREQEQSLEEAETITEKCEAAETELLELRHELDVARNEISMLGRKNDDLEQQLIDAKGTLKDRSRTKQKLEKLLNDVASAIETVLTPTAEEDCAESQSDILKSRRSLLESLLLLLNSAADIGVGPSMSTFGTGAASDDVEDGDEAAEARGNVSHYQLGDLGLVPRPEQRISSSATTGLQRGPSGVASRRSARRNPPCHTTSTQTVSPIKAMFLMDLSANHQYTVKPAHGTGRRTSDRLPSIAQQTLASMPLNKSPVY